MLTLKEREKNLLFIEKDQLSQYRCVKSKDDADV